MCGRRPISVSAEEPTSRVSLLPLHLNGVSKVAQDLLAYQYWKNDEIGAIRGRIFNTTGSRKRDDVVSDFARRAARIGREGGRLRVGNTETRRAILDVRDSVEALIRLAAAGGPGEAYNICGQIAYPISEFITILEKLTNRAFELAPDPALLRPTDEAAIFGDSSKLRAHTGWKTNCLDRRDDRSGAEVRADNVRSLSAQAQHSAAVGPVVSDCSVTAFGENIRSPRLRAEYFEKPGWGQRIGGRPNNRNGRGKLACIGVRHSE